MEDGHCMIDGYGDWPEGNAAFFAIYDGHGGTEAVEFVQANLHKVFLEELQRVKHLQHLSSTFKNAFSSSYCKIDDQMKMKKIGIESGCTSVTAFLRVSNDLSGKVEKKLCVANAGDVRSRGGGGGGGRRCDFSNEMK